MEFFFSLALKVASDVYADSSSTSCCAMAHTKPANSRATAVIALLEFILLASKRINRLCSRFCAFQAMARTSLDTPWLRRRISRLM